eukprot:CAMPEP_0206478768 /NCGR_PEP_ID=MMETSP0324_2-20121206/36271_1 /ASSEMBLY_ACC=CAM_ASM_000836 /TAXON_ID=2866 /ORGANISM="Crypthecodinium cohnii, Strain Seligo" /LENGTH=231 /DNA_ID=CAMNT_0053955179 /DNA_START=39 /DNA_END=731 /DNA_ORIENTATION=-
MSFQPRGGKGKGKRKGGGGGFGKGKGSGGAGGGAAGVFSDGVPSGPVLNQPPIYKPEFMKRIPQPSYPPCAEDRDLVQRHRQLTLSWKESCFRVEAESANSSEIALRALKGRSLMADLDIQQKEITRAGGVNANYFPTELLLPALLPAKANKSAKDLTARERNVVEALKRLEKTDSGKNPAGDKEVDAEGHDAMLEEEEVDDNNFGDDDDLGQYGDFEDGMGNDFEDEGPG